MAKIIGNTTATTVPQSDMNQTDPTKADYIKNKPVLGALALKSTVEKSDVSTDVQESLEKADNSVQSVAGKGLSTNDYTTAEKNKLAGISESADSVSFSQNATSGNKVGTITINGTSTNLYAPIQTTISGNAGTATKLATARTISLSGDASGSITFDGSADKTLAVTVADDSHNHVISNVDGLQTALDNKLSLDGGRVTDNLSVDGVLKNGRIFNNIVTFQSTTNVDEIVIKTKIPYQSSNEMPLIHLKGYAYGVASPIEITVAFYIYKDQFYSMGATSTCPWKPTIYLSSYTQDSTNYVALSLSGIIYYPCFVVDMIDIWSNSSRDYSSGWTTTVRNYDSTGATASVIPTENKAAVPYRSIANDISGNASTATKATQDASGNVITSTYATKAVATTSANGLMSSTDKSKLDNIAANANNYSHPTYTAVTGKPTANATPGFGGTFTVSQITSDGTGHVTGATDRTVTIPSTVATTSAAGLMSAADKEKLDGIAAGATKITVDSALSSTSTNPVQNKVINSALAGKASSTHTHDYIPTSQKGVANGVATLDDSGKVPSSQLPSYVDDVIEAATKSNFPTTGETGKIYVDIATNKTYRWSGSSYVEISASLAIGTTSSTAAAGNHTHAVATTDNAGFMSATDKSKLDGIETGANNYSHPTTSGNKHIPSGGSSGQILRWSEDGTAVWGADTDTKVTSVDNHYTPSANDASQLSVDASSSTAATWGSTSLVTGVNLQRDAKGHVTGVTVDSIKMPANPNSNTAHAHTAGTGLTVSGSGGTSGTTTYSANLNSTTSLGTIGTTSKLYAVGVDANGKLCVNVPWTDTDTNTHHTAYNYVGAADSNSNAATSNGSTYLKLYENGSKRSQFKITGSGATEVSSDANGNITINSTNTTYSTATTSANGLMSSTDKSKLDGIATGATKTVIDSTLSDTSTNPVQNKVIKEALDGKAASSHTHSSYVNQNAFSNIAVGATTVAADSVTSTLTLVAGSNVTITPDATNDKITIAATDTKYSAATTSAAGLMSAADKTKLDGMPTITSSDNGKFLRVVDGSWAAVTIPDANGVSF